MHVPPLQLTRLIPDAKGTKCNVELEPVENTKHCSILRVPFKTEDGKDLRQWVSRFDIYPYLERYAQVRLQLPISCYVRLCYSK
jgi:sucrose synthase